MPKNKEAIRLEALKSYEILDSSKDEAYDDFTHLASQITGCPIALVSLVDESRQWFKSAVGLDVCETDRSVSFCAFNLDSPKPMIVPDATKDDRFKENGLVTGDPFIRFYAGAPIIDQDNLTLGSLCVIDRKPRELSAEQIDSLHRLSRRVMNLIEIRKTSRHLAEALSTIETFRKIIPVCCYCNSIKNQKGAWKDLQDYITNHPDFVFSHGICDKCYEREFADLK